MDKKQVLLESVEFFKKACIALQLQTQIIQKSLIYFQINTIDKNNVSSISGQLK